MLINGYKLVWQDEFKDGKLNRDFWDFYASGEAKRLYTEKSTGKEIECTSIKANADDAYVENNQLHLSTRKIDKTHFTSVDISTRNSLIYKYGYLEISAKLGKGPAASSAFWLNSAGLPFERGPEIDIYENFGRDDRIASNLHRWWYEKDENGVPMHEPKFLRHDQFASQVHWTLRNTYLPEGQYFYEHFHRFGLDWTPERMDFYLDGNCYMSVDITGEYFKDFHQPMYIILAHAFTVDINNSEVTESPNDDIIDYIRLYQRENGVLIDPKKDEIKL